ncbi:MAG: RnfABCDGE type electron transport complex subunit D [Bacilli bacterium]|jgi:electron transport complex protein RnfD
MNFGFDNGPHIKDKAHTSKIMFHLFISLIPIILFAIYKNGILPYMGGYTNLYGALKPLLMIILGLSTSLLVELLYLKFALKIKEKLWQRLKESYAMFPGLFLVLALPINTPLWLIILGSLVATLIGKLLFGGFGFNIFNPALVGAIFVASSYGSVIGTYLNSMELDTLAGATPLTNLGSIDYVGTWSSIVEPFGHLRDFIFGFIPGSLGETSKILIFISFVYLAITKVIKWIIPVSYIAIVFIMTSIIGYMNNMDIWYAFFNIFSGGLMFGAVFMATDPVTSPTTRIGQVLFGLGLGILTVIFRYLTPYPEGVLTSILTMNMLVYIIDRIGAKAKFKSQYRYIPICVLLIIIASLSLYIGNSLKKTTEEDDKYKIVDVRESDNQTIYDVTQKGFHGLIKATITIANDKIVLVSVTSQSETYWTQMSNDNYLNKLITDQANLDNVDAYSGATITSNALKDMIKKTLKAYEDRQ